MHIVLINYQKNIKNNQCFIINTDPNNKPGVHWVSVYKFINYFYWYDTFKTDKNIIEKYILCY